MSSPTSRGPREPAAAGETHRFEALAQALDALPVGVAIYDASDDSFRVTYLNQRARELAGPGGSLGATFAEAYPDAAPNGIWEFMAEARRTGEERHLRGVVTVAGRAWDIDIRPLRDGSGAVRSLLVTGQEVTRQRETQRRLEAMLASTEAMWRPMSIGDEAGQAAEQAARLLPSLDCAVALVHPDAPSVLQVEAVNADWMRPFEGAEVPFEGPASGEVFGEHRAIELTPEDVQEPFGALMVQAGAGAIRVVPLTTGEDLPDGRGAMGLLLFTTRGARALDGAERALADEFAKGVSLALHRAELLSQARENADRLQFGLDLALDLTASLDTGEVMEGLLERAIRAVEADRATLLQIDEEGVEVEASMDLGGSAIPPGSRMPMVSPEFERLVRERRPYVGSYDTSGWPPELRATLDGVVQSLSVPLLLAGEVAGALTVSRRRPEPFSARDVAVMEQIGTVAVLALRNARLFQEAEAERLRADLSVRRLRAGVEVAVDLGRRLDRVEVVRRFLVHAVRAVGAELATLARVEGGEIVVEGSHSTAGEPVERGTRFPIHAHPAFEQAISERRPVQTETAVTGALSPAGLELEHVIAVPLVDQDQVVATLGVSRASGEPFGEEDVATLEQIGNVAVLALRNASLFAEAEAAARAKTDFMNMAAHELRTPLSVLGGYVSMLRDGTFGPPPASWQEPIEIISAKAAELTDLVDELLMAARIESGTISARTAETDLGEAIEAALKRARPRAGLLEATIATGIPARRVIVTADPDHVARILDNLVNNALTYTSGRPWLQVTLAVEGGQAVASFEDHGRGVPEEMREHIFEQFVRLEDEGPYHPGTGLGLYISRGLAERSGGSLTLAGGGPGRGSVFVLRLPLAD